MLGAELGEEKRYGTGCGNGACGAIISVKSFLLNTEIEPGVHIVYI